MSPSVLVQSANTHEKGPACKAGDVRFGNVQYRHISAELSGDGGSGHRQLSELREIFRQIEQGSDSTSTKPGSHVGIARTRRRQRDLN